MPAERYDLVVIGAGSAGITAARAAAALAARVALVERGRPGGDCLWTGCVPSKALIAAAGAAAAVRRSARFGVHAGEPSIDFAEVLAHVKDAQRRIEPADSQDALRAAGVELVPGVARFRDRRAVLVDARRLDFGAALVATGSEPLRPQLPGLDGAPLLTSETVWELTELPARMVVLGGGAIGCELGQAFARLGSEVTVVEAEPRLLPLEEPAASRVIAAALAADGVAVRTGTSATGWSGGGVLVRAGIRNSDPNRGSGGPGARDSDPNRGSAGPEELLHCDALLAAVGRLPRTANLGLDAAGVGITGRGHVVVDSRLRTSNPRIFAAGDVTGAPAFTHVAGVHGTVAAYNALLGPVRRARVTDMPWVTFTDPEVARVGATVAAARARNGRVVVRRVAGAHLDRAVTDGRPEGFTALVGDARGRLLGATVVSPRAGETIAELAAVIGRGGRLRDIAAVVHPYPTYGDGPWLAGIMQLQAGLGRPVVRRLVRLVRTLRGLAR